MEETQEQITARIVAQAATATAKAVSEAAQAAAIVIAKDNNIFFTEIAVLKTEMNTLKNQQTSFESEINRRMDTSDTNLDAKFDRIFKKLDEMAQGRPTWAMAILLGGLMTICTGLAVFILTKGV